VVEVKRKTMVLGLGFAALVYLVLFFYVFGFAPMITSSSQSKWVEIELSKEPKFSDTEICKECHYQLYIGMKNHSTVNCEACHGSGVEHTIKRSSDTIVIDKTRDACLKCHLDVEGRDVIETVNETHHAGVYCVVCHDPHR
jgi:RNase P subunit RPR2